jgi:hypothetical protein
VNGEGTTSAPDNETSTQTNLYLSRITTLVYNILFNEYSTAVVGCEARVALGRAITIREGDILNQTSATQGKRIWFRHTGHFLFEIAGDQTMSA